MMSFHPHKCQLLRITRNKSPVKASYVIHGHTLVETDTAKYLGVSLHRHSSWSPHVNATAKKANGTRAFLQRNLRKAPTAVKMRTYESLIRPILEYSGVVWDPHNAQDVNKLEMGRKHAGTPKYVCMKLEASGCGCLCEVVGDWDVNKVVNYPIHNGDSCLHTMTL